MYHYVYKITFESGHWYIGKRSCYKVPSDDSAYNGSGIIVKRFMSTGMTFIKEVLSEHKTSKEAFDAEKETLGDSYITESYANKLGKCLNLIAGGKSYSQADAMGEKNPFYGKSHTDESKEKISKANKGKLVGEKNPRFGVPCVHTGKKGSDHPMSKMIGEKNANFGKKQYCDLLGNITMADPSNVPEDYYPWSRWGFSDKELRRKYPKELRGNW